MQVIEVVPGATYSFGGWARGAGNCRMVVYGNAKPAFGPVDILVNDRLIARGEVVVVDENFGVRIVEVLPRSREVGKVS